MKALIIFAWLCLFGLPAVAEAESHVKPQAADAERSALAHRYLELS